MSEKLRVVIDTQILFRALINQKSLPARLVFELDHLYTFLVSEATIAEIEDVINRPEMRKKFKFTDAIVSKLREWLTKGELIKVENVPAVSRDAKDDIFLACAETGKADVIVSEDKDLLVLHPYKNIQILDALAFLRLIEPKSS